MIGVDIMHVTNKSASDFEWLIIVYIFNFACIEAGC